MIARPEPAATPELQPLAVGAKQLSIMLNLSVRTIRSMDSAGKLSCPVKLNGRAIRWVLDGENGIRAWLAAGCPDRATWEAHKIMSAKK